MRSSSSSRRSVWFSAPQHIAWHMKRRSSQGQVLSRRLRRVERGGVADATRTIVRSSLRCIGNKASRRACSSSSSRSGPTVRCQSAVQSSSSGSSSNPPDSSSMDLARSGSCCAARTERLADGVSSVAPWSAAILAHRPAQKGAAGKRRPSHAASTPSTPRKASPSASRSAGGRIASESVSSGPASLGSRGTLSSSSLIAHEAVRCLRLLVWVLASVQRSKDGLDAELA